MIVWQRELKRRLSTFVGPMIGLALVCYFVYHGLQGDRGLLSWARLSQKLEHAEKNLEKIQAERKRLEERVSLLKPESLHLEMLDQRAREVLGVQHPDEIILMTPSHSSSPKS